MERGKRIPLHDHSGQDSGGAINASSINRLIGADTGSGGSSVVAGPTTLADLTDVTITSATAADRLRYNGTAWVNTSLIWRPVMTYDGTNWLVSVTGSGDAILTEA